MLQIRNWIARLASNPTAVAVAAAVVVVAVAATMALAGDAALVGDAAHTLGGTENETLVEPMDGGTGSGGPTGIGTGEGD
jgi:hypothetical protein